MKHKQLICLLLGLLLMSCGTNTNPSESTQTEQDTAVSDTIGMTETAPAYTPLPETDMDGWDMHYFNYDNTKITWVEHILVADEQTGDTLNDAVYERNARVGELYNATFSETAVTDTAAQIAQLVQSGDPFASMVMLYDETVVTPYTSGYLQTWDVLPYVDFSAEYWNKSSTETFSASGKVFAATGDFSLGQSTRSFILLFNKDMYTDLGLTEDLYALTQEGKWTVDKLLEAESAAVADLDGDGEMTDKDRYGSTGAVKLYFGSLVTGAGIKYIDIDENGEPYFAIPGNEYAITVLSSLMERHNGNHIFHQVHMDVHNGSNEANAYFHNNQILFCGSSMRAIANYRDMESDIGILPFPKYTEEQDRYYALTSGGTMATLPKTLPADTYENVGILLEALCRDSHTSVIPTYKETLLKSRYARDEGSAAMLDIIFASAVYDLGLSVIPSETYYKYMEPYLKGTDTFVSLTQTLTNTVEARLADLLKSAE